MSCGNRALSEGDCGLLRQASRQCHSTCRMLLSSSARLVAVAVCFGTDAMLHCPRKPATGSFACGDGPRRSASGHFLFCERETEKRKRGERTMAIYHLEAKVVSRGAGRSAVAASAYLSCSRLYNDYDGIQHDYTKKQGTSSGRRFSCRNMPSRNGRIVKNSGTP